MGNQKQKWTAEEEEALLAGVAKHGPGKWKNILRDPDFSSQLIHRSNIDLKDKWRNLSVTPGSQGSKDKIRTPKVKAAAAAVAAAAASAGIATPNAVNSSTAASLPHSASSDLTVDDNCLNIVVDAKNVPRYDGMIFEALSALADANGSDISAIVNFIEQRHEVPPNFRRVLGSRLRRLAAQGKLVKLQNLYKICDSMGTRAPTPRHKETNLKPRQSSNQGPVVSQEMVEEAAITAAYKVVEAENKTDVARATAEELERMMRIAEEADAFLELAKDIHERCNLKDHLNLSSIIKDNMGLFSAASAVLLSMAGVHTAISSQGAIATINMTENHYHNHP